MELSIIIVSYNTQTLLRNCLVSLSGALRFSKISKQEVIVVDNASVDGSCEMVRKQFPQVILIRNKKNSGFSKANNQGIKIAKGKFLLFINSDTNTSKNALLKMLQSIKQANEIGVVGPKLLNTDKSIQPSCGFFPSIARIFMWMNFLDDLPLIKNFFHAYHIDYLPFYKKQHFVDWVSGACFMVKKEVIQKTKGFDEKIFMYGEEMEWCYRIKKAGYQILYSPDVQVIHLKGKSSAEDNEAGIVEEFKSLVYFYKKHKNYFEQFLLRFLLIWGAWLRIIIFGIIGKYPKRVKLYAKILKLV